MFYRHTLKDLVRRLWDRGVQTHIKPEEPYVDEEGRPTLEYCGWMLTEIGKMDCLSGDLKQATKAARWLGWVLLALEQHGVIEGNEESRDLVRRDVKEGYDLPGPAHDL